MINFLSTLIPHKRHLLVMGIGKSLLRFYNVYFWDVTTENVWWLSLCFMFLGYYCYWKYVSDCGLCVQCPTQQLRSFGDGTSN